ncbi:MAG TPA: hypothetical protein VLB85_07355 [Acidimicrobiia bacterium]|nr:hypothetical protein [Acidimicrobiia bacterium]
MAIGKKRAHNRRSRRKAAADCKQGNHRYGSPRYIGGGMTRQTCSVCRAVSIDITRADAPAVQPSTDSASSRPRR